MKVTVWVHELSDLPDEYSPDYLGPVTVDNQELWDVIDDRYEWILGQALPQVDGLVLTVVETQFNATEAEIMHKLVTLIDQKCRKYGKQLTVRTFVWKPDELEGVMTPIQTLPDDIVVMSKIVPQDWQIFPLPTPRRSARSESIRRSWSLMSPANTSSATTSPIAWSTGSKPSLILPSAKMPRASACGPIVLMPRSSGRPTRLTFGLSACSHRAQ